MTIVVYFVLARGNPGYIMGNTAEVEKRSRQYDPKDYELDSCRKEETAAPAKKSLSAHKRTLSFLSNKLKNKKKESNARTHFDLPPLESDVTVNN